MGKIILFAGALGILFASLPASAEPTRSCNQTLEKCVADRVATGSNVRKANQRCVELLSACKKK